MAKPAPMMSVAVVDHTAFVKIPGRANFSSSVDFKTLISQLRERGFNHFVLDLGECVTMDSTFLGVLAGFAMRNADEREKNGDSHLMCLELLNPNGRVTDLLENLGVIHLFKVLNEPVPCTALFEPVASRSPLTKEEQTRTCLEAHNLLMKIDPNNVPKFKEVTQFLAEDLRKMRDDNNED
jgi:anti-sigma B factor antagonist